MIYSFYCIGLVLLLLIQFFIFFLILNSNVITVYFPAASIYKYILFLFINHCLTTLLNSPTLWDFQPLFLQLFFVLLFLSSVLPGLQVHKWKLLKLSHRLWGSVHFSFTFFLSVFHLDNSYWYTCMFTDSFFCLLQPAVELIWQVFFFISVIVLSAPGMLQKYFYCSHCSVLTLYVYPLTH